jgi:hypothetical protein
MRFKGHGRNLFFWQMQLQHLEFWTECFEVRGDDFARACVAF